MVQGFKAAIGEPGSGTAANRLRPEHDIARYFC